MKPGDIALVHGPSLVDTLIRWGTRSRYNHVRLIVSERGDTVEALAHGAQRGHVQPGDLIVSPPLTVAQRARVSGIADTLVLANGGHGVPYGFADVAALGLYQFGVRLPVITERIRDPHTLFCSQLADYVWTRVGYHAFTDGRTPQAVSPGDLADLAFREGWPSEVVK